MRKQMKTKKDLQTVLGKELSDKASPADEVQLLNPLRTALAKIYTSSALYFFMRTSANPLLLDGVSDSEQDLTYTSEHHHTYLRVLDNLAQQAKLTTIRFSIDGQKSTPRFGYEPEQLTWPMVHIIKGVESSYEAYVAHLDDLHDKELLSMVEKRAPKGDPRIYDHFRKEGIKPISLNKRMMVMGPDEMRNIIDWVLPDSVSCWTTSPSLYR